MAGRLALSLAILAALGAAAVAFVVPDRPALAADQKLTARPQIGQPVEAAEQLLKQKKFKEALAKLAEADAVPDKTPYESYVIEGTRAAVDLSSGDEAGGIKALEAVLATGILAPADALARVQALAQLEYQIKNYPQATLYANRYFRDGGTDAATRILLAQAYYLQNDFADAAKTIGAVLAADRASGKRPDENILLMLLNSEYQQKDEPGRIEALEMLVADYGKPEYWTDLLTAIEKKPGFSSRLTLDLDLLMAGTGSLNTEDAIMEAAQLALLAGLPGDAKSFLDKGYASGVLGKGSGADREKRLADMASRQASEDLKSLPQLENEAAAATHRPCLGQARRGLCQLWRGHEGDRRLAKGHPEGRSAKSRRRQARSRDRLSAQRPEGSSQGNLVRRDRRRRRARPGPALADRGRGRIVLRGIMIPHSSTH